jgi:hypothetical protein
MTQIWNVKPRLAKYPFQEILLRIGKLANTKTVDLNVLPIMIKPPLEAPHKSQMQYKIWEHQLTTMIKEKANPYFGDDPLTVVKTLIDYGFSTAKKLLASPQKLNTSQNYEHATATFYHGPIDPDNTIREKFSVHVNKRAQSKITKLAHPSFPKTSALVHPSVSKSVFVSNSKQEVKDFAKVIQTQNGKAAYTPKEFNAWQQSKRLTQPLPPKTTQTQTNYEQNTRLKYSQVKKRQNPKRQKSSPLPTTQ